MSKKRKRTQASNPPTDTTRSLIDRYWNTLFLVLFALIPVLYFAPFISSNVMIGGSDYLIGGYPFEKWSLEQSSMPLWYPHVFSGYPVLGQPVGGPLAPLAQLRHFIPPHVTLAFSFILVFFAAGLGTYLLLKTLGLSMHAAAFGALAYQFAGNLAATPMAGHLGRAASIALFPLMMLFIHKGLATKKMAHFIFFSLVTALAFYEGHFQLTYYALLTIAAYAVYYLITHRREYRKYDILKVLGYGILSVILIGVLMAIVWLPVLNSLKLVARGSARGYDYAISWAMPPLELMDLIVPTFSGLLDNYWGTNAFKLHTEYFGIVYLVMAIITIGLCWRKPHVKYFAFLAAVSVLLSIGGATPFFKFAYYVIPFFKLTRAPSLAFYLAAFSFICLASIGLDDLILKNAISKRRFATVCLSAIICIIVFLLIFASIGRSIAATKADLFEKNLGQLYQGAVISLIIIAVFFSLAFLVLRKTFKPGVAVLIIMAISIAYQLTITSRFLQKAPPPDKYYAADDIVRYLHNDRTIYRVFPCTFPTPYGEIGYQHAKDTYLLYHDIQSAGGYAPNPLQRYQDFVGAGTSVMFVPMNLLQNPALIDMLNLKYLLMLNLPQDMSAYDPGIQRAVLPIKTFLSRYRQVYAGYQFSVYQNDSVLPRAYVVPDYEVHTAGEVMDRLRSASFDRYSKVVLEDDPRVPHPPARDRYVAVDLKSYSANRVECESNAPFAGFLVLADNWHPDWKVYVDGREQKLYRANYTLRAVYIEAGRHEVAFVYQSRYFALGSVITLTGIAIILAFFFPHLLWLVVSRTGRLLGKRKTGGAGGPNVERSETKQP